MAEQQIIDLSIEAKIAIAIRLAEVIDNTKDPEALGGLRVLFNTIIKDLAYPKVH